MPLDAQPIRPLTRQQERVVELLCRGWNNRRIARALGISPSTVKGHVMSIDNLFTWPRDPEVSPRERIRIWALHRIWQLKQLAEDRESA